MKRCAPSFVLAFWIVIFSGQARANQTDMSQSSNVVDAGPEGMPEQDSPSDIEISPFSKSWSAVAGDIHGRDLNAAYRELEKISEYEKTLVFDGLLTKFSVAEKEPQPNVPNIEKFIRALRDRGTIDRNGSLESVDDAFLIEFARDIASLKSKKMLGGKIAAIRDFPWFVSLRIRVSKGLERCAGTRIGVRFILTAAHCLENDSETGQRVKKEDIEASIGSENYLNGIKPKVIDIHFHHKWRKTPIRWEYDAALIEIQPLQSWVFPINLHSGYVTPEYGSLWGGGWGHTEFLGPSFKLNVGLVSPQPQQICAEMWKSAGADNLVSEAMLCAGARKIANCQGDSGAPLLAGTRSKTQIVGIVSWTATSCQTDGMVSPMPEIYTRISAIVDWLRTFPNLAPLVTSDLPGTLFRANSQLSLEMR